MAAESAAFCNSSWVLTIHPMSTAKATIANKNVNSTATKGATEARRRLFFRQRRGICGSFLERNGFERRATRPGNNHSRRITAVDTNVSLPGTLPLIGSQVTLLIDTSTDTLTH